MDRQSRKTLHQALQALKARGSKIVVTSQSKRFGESADKVLILGGSGENRTNLEERPNHSHFNVRKEGDSGPQGGRIRPVK